MGMPSDIFNVYQLYCMVEVLQLHVILYLELKIQIVDGLLNIFNVINLLYKNYIFGLVGIVFGRCKVS